MKLKIVLLLLGLIFGSLPGYSALAADDPPARGTWTRQPAARWEAGFLTGNGRMGAIVFGQPANETIVLNHCRMYRTLGGREIVPDLTDRMDEARQAAKTGGPDGFHKFVRQTCHEAGWRSIIWTDPFHPAGVLKLAMKAPPEAARDYRLSEDFMTGEVAVRWDDSRGPWQRRLFVSRPDNVAVLSLQGPHGAVSFDLTLEIGHADIPASIRSEPAPQGAWVTAHCVYAKGKGGYDLALRVVLQGGKLECAGEKVSVAGADGCLLLAQVVPWKTPLPKDQSEAWTTNAENPDFAADRLGRYVPAPGLGESSVIAYLNQEQAAELMPQIRAVLGRLPADYAALLAPHAKVHGELMGRVAVDLSGGEDRRLATDELLARSVRDGSLPPALMERFPSMMMSYWPGQNGFGCDPVGTLPEVVHNALIFSLDGQVDLLPALPKDWPQGELRGTRARGQLRIERLAWDLAAGKLQLELTSGRDQTLALRPPPAIKVKESRVSEGAKLEPRSDGCFGLSLQAHRKAVVELNW